jgi:alpha-glucosidase
MGTAQTEPVDVVLDEPHHDGSELYVNRVGDSAEVRLRAPEDAADAVFLRFLKDGEPRIVEATPGSQHDGEVWWHAELPLRNPSVSYRWLLTGGRPGYRWLNGTGAYPYEVTPADDFRVLAQPAGAEWHLSAVGYEVYLDRFARSGAVRALPSWAVPRDWGREPESQTHATNFELFGGDLLGVEQHLDHITSLGANMIWLTAFFPAESSHRYDPSSYDRVDPLLGGEEALVSLLRAAHERGVRIFGDISLDHVGSTHEWFTVARDDPSSVERGFFLFDRSETHAFAAWRGAREFPRFDWRSDDLRTRLSGTARRWLDLGLDGWRIGAADMVGRYRDLDLNADVARWFRRELGEVPLVAEYWNDFRADLDGLGWHGVMNYCGFLRPVWWWLRSDSGAGAVFDVFTSAEAPSYDAHQASIVMGDARAGMPWDAVLHSWLLLDSHDTPRFRTVSGSVERQLVGVGLQMTTPGVPMLYAGDEVGLEGLSGRGSRHTMRWDGEDRWDQRLLADFRKLIALRRSSDALARGGLRLAHVGDDVMLYLRESKVERVLCLAARAPHPPLRVPFDNLETLYGDDVRDGVLPSHGPAFHAWRIAS